MDLSPFFLYHTLNEKSEFFPHTGEKFNMEGLIIFNVSGKRYETMRATIMNHPHTMLAMIVAQAPQDKREFFIDRNRKLFHWILEWYHTQILVDHKCAGVPENMWNDEVGYYCLDKPGEAILEEDCMEPSTKKHASGVDAIVDTIREEREAAKRERYVIYDELMTWMLSFRPANAFEFAQHYDHSGQFPDTVPKSVFTLKPEWMNANSVEWKNYAASKSIVIEFDYNKFYRKKSYAGYPACRHAYIAGVQECMRITIYVKLSN